MTTAGVATSSRKIVAIDVPPALLTCVAALQRQLQSYIVSNTNSSKTIKSAKPPGHPHRFCQVHNEVAPPIVQRNMTAQRLATHGVQDGRPVGPLTTA
jgi:hypothetical protein